MLETVSNKNFFAHHRRHSATADDFSEKTATIASICAVWKLIFEHSNHLINYFKLFYKFYWSCCKINNPSSNKVEFSSCLKTHQSGFGTKTLANFCSIYLGHQIHLIHEFSHENSHFSVQCFVSGHLIYQTNSNFSQKVRCLLHAILLDCLFIHFVRLPEDNSKLKELEKLNNNTECLNSSH